MVSMNSILLHGGDLGGRSLSGTAAIGDIITTNGLLYRVDEEAFAVFIGEGEKDSDGFELI